MEFVLDVLFSVFCQQNCSRFERYKAMLDASR